jgi:hypothetical protein
MNWSEIESRWEPMKALLMSYWPTLNEDDLTRIDGKRDVLAQVLRERLGLDAEAAICAFEKDVRRPGAVK